MAGSASSILATRLVLSLTMPLQPSKLLRVCRMLPAPSPKARISLPQLRPPATSNSRTFWPRSRPWCNSSTVASQVPSLNLPCYPKFSNSLTSIRHLSLPSSKTHSWANRFKPVVRYQAHLAFRTTFQLLICCSKNQPSSSGPWKVYLIVRRRCRPYSARIHFRSLSSL